MLTLKLENGVDILFEYLECENSNHIAVQWYNAYKFAVGNNPGKLSGEIVASCTKRLAIFNLNELQELVRYDELELDRIGDKKTILFVVGSVYSPELRLLTALLYTQALDSLCERSDNNVGRLPLHVRFLLDDFSDIGIIQNFCKWVAVLRGRNISVAVIVQSLSQLKYGFSDGAERFISLCDSVLYLGRHNAPEFEELSKIMEVPQKMLLLKPTDCILKIRGEKPFYSKKYDLKKHPNYRS